MVVFRRVLLSALFAYWALMLVLTHVPMPRIEGPRFSDKLPHFVGYLALAALLYGCLWLYRPSFTAAPVVVLAACALYGAIDECTQPWFNRTADVADWMANMTGASMAVIVVGAAQWWWRSLLKHRGESRSDGDGPA